MKAQPLTVARNGPRYLELATTLLFRLLRGATAASYTSTAAAREG
jgi:hypothetical protein